jgi:hypothetical protein
MKHNNKYIEMEINIGTQKKEIRNLRNNIDNTNSVLNDRFEKLGMHTFNCMLDNSESINHFDIDSHLKDIITDLKNIDRSKAKIQAIEDSLIEDLILYENNKYQEGFENAKSKLQEELCYGEIGELDFMYELFFTERWFEKYDQIRSLRIQRYENRIIWAEMEDQINQLLEIEYQDN